MPALLKTTSRRPCRATARSTAAATCASSVTSQRAYDAASAPSSAATACPRSSCTSARMTLAPFLTNSSAVALPMPLAPPVMTATFPANLQTRKSHSHPSPIRNQEDEISVPNQWLNATPR
ncbi:Os07g0663650 [Oryza sativa Japonica Group]|uniref:Os07g0663650 protein n=1 Tax=Oryza sativa subsp. japonica TaxID=39947 RepID=A0A0P0X9U8_ORYSJ|nr:hypothetical protein EE612_041211 [Oryza sativa]BAT03080.1 Os07g0663650 [Oryza sativa Japonica Group]